MPDRIERMINLIRGGEPTWRCAMDSDQVSTAIREVLDAEPLFAFTFMNGQGFIVGKRFVSAADAETGDQAKLVLIRRIIEGNDDA